MRKQGMPNRFELVVCKVVKIFPNSVLAELLEYRKRGMIHVSEVALRWVKNIREFVKPNQHIVCQVMRVQGSDINLSLKRVRKPDAERKMNEFKRETKAEKMLELVAKSMKKDLDKAYDEVGYTMQEEFGSIHKAFETAFKDPELFLSKDIDKAWGDLLIDMAKKSFTEKEYEVKAIIELSCHGPDGVGIIKKVLNEASKDGLEVSYVSAPNYVIIGRGKNIKQVKAKVKETMERIEREMTAHRGTCEFEIKESK